MNRQNPPSEYYIPLNMNGLHGRMLRLPAKRADDTRQVLMLYGHHASLERVFGIAEALTEYGTVTCPDFPGFGGMESFEKIGEKITLDAFADYMAAFVKLKYSKQKVTIAAMSFGFVVATRMLQKYPELVDHVELLVSIVGFTHKDDYKVPAPTMFAWKALSRIVAIRPFCWIFRYVFLSPLILRNFYAKMPNAKHKFKGLSAAEKKKNIEFEIYLWHCNDVKTWVDTAYIMLTLDLVKGRVDLPVHHIAVTGDQYFDRAVVEQHMRIIYSDYIEYPADMLNHAPSIIADEATAASMFPQKLRARLATQ